MCEARAFALEKGTAPSKSFFTPSIAYGRSESSDHAVSLTSDSARSVENKSVSSCV